MALQLPAGMQITGAILPQYESILTPMRWHSSLNCIAPSKAAARNC